jgi:hypothetical protein
MPLTLADPLSRTLHGFLVRRTVQERNKELALALVRAANEGKACCVTDAWHPEGLYLACESVVADGERVALRLTATARGETWCLLEELRFDGAGRVVEHHGARAPLDGR